MHGRECRRVGLQLLLFAFDLLLFRLFFFDFLLGSSSHGHQGHLGLDPCQRVIVLGYHLQVLDSLLVFELPKHSCCPGTNVPIGIPQGSDHTIQHLAAKCGNGHHGVGLDHKLFDFNCFD